MLCHPPIGVTSYTDRCKFLPPVVLLRMEAPVELEVLDTEPPMAPGDEACCIVRPRPVVQRWRLSVDGSMQRRSAISLLLKPSIIRTTISRCRAVRSDIGGASHYQTRPSRARGILHICKRLYKRNTLKLRETT